MDINQVRPRLSDERGFIIGWLGKLAIGFVVVAVVLFDGGSIMVNFFTLDSTADEIAVQLTTGVSVGDLSPTDLEPRARELAKASGARLVSLTVEGTVVKITLRRKAKTLIVGRIGALEDWTKATAEGQAGAT